MAKHVDGAIDNYIAKEACWLKAIEATDTAYTKVDASFFGDAVEVETE